MQNIILERARVAHFQSALSARILRKQRNAYRRAKTFKVDLNGDVCDVFCGSVMPMRCFTLGRNVKMFYTNITPLSRYLTSCLGQPWNVIYSDIREHLTFNSKKRLEIMIDLKWRVAVHTIRSTDGRVWAWGLYHNTCDHIGDFYVEPETGLLRAGNVK